MTTATREGGMRVLLVGEESAGIQTLRRLAASPHTIVAVMASEPTARGGATVWGAASQLGVQAWPARRVRDAAFAREIEAAGVDVIVNVHSLFIIHRDVLAAARLGGFNMHPGPLPRYAGLNTISWAIYHGEPSYGVTIHEMVESIDGGRIAGQASFPIEATDTPLILMSKCVRAGVPLLMDLLAVAARDPAALDLRQQDLSQRRYFGPEVPESGRICWSRRAQQVADFIRACDYAPYASPWGHPRASLRGRNLAIGKASVTGEPAKAPPGTVGAVSQAGARVACADEWILVSQILMDRKPERPVGLLSPGDMLEDGV